MDPNTCLGLLVDALEMNDREDAREHATNLAKWLRGGGFMPVIDPHVFDFILSTLADRLEDR